MSPGRVKWSLPLPSQVSLGKMSLPSALRTASSQKGFQIPG